MTVALEGGEWSAARPGSTLPPGKTRYPLYRRIAGLQGRSGWAENLVPSGIRFLTVQPIIYIYTHTHTHTSLTRSERFLSTDIASSVTMLKDKIFILCNFYYLVRGDVDRVIENSCLHFIP